MSAQTLPVPPQAPAGLFVPVAFGAGALYARFQFTTPMRMVQQIHSPTHADSRERG